MGVDYETVNASQTLESAVSADPEIFVNRTDREIEDVQIDSSWEIPAHVGIEECDDCVPFSSENHFSTLSRGEVLVGGGRRGKMRKGPKPRKPGRREPRYVQHTLMVSPNQIVPAETMVRLKWPSSFVLTSVGATATSKRWIPNSAFDLDPVLGSTATPGFGEWSRFYSFYRVVSYSYVLEVQNAQPFPITAYTINSNNDPGTAGVNFESYSVNNFGDRRVLSPVGAATANHIFRKKVKISQILGSEAAETDDNYRSLVTGSPADLIWMALGLNTTGANLMTAAGVYCQLVLTVNVKFYGRIDLTI